MDFERFKTHAISLSELESEMIRERYINTFIDTEKPFYRKMIQKKHKFSDGYCYIGYLWDYLKNPIVIQAECFEQIVNAQDIVYVFWDIHSCDRIFISDYWRFGKNTVLRISFSELLKGKEYLPEDIYIFDKTFSWTLVMTHEDINGVPYCLKSEIRNTKVNK